MEVAEWRGMLEKVSKRYSGHMKEREREGREGTIQEEGKRERGVGWWLGMFVVSGNSGPPASLSLVMPITHFVCVILNGCLLALLEAGESCICKQESSRDILRQMQMRPKGGEWSNDE